MISVDRHVAFGEVVGVHIDECFIRNGRLDTAVMQPIVRCGYSDYAMVDKVFAIARPQNADGDAADKGAGGGVGRVLVHWCPLRRESGRMSCGRKRRDAQKLQQLLFLLAKSFATS